MRSSDWSSYVCSSDLTEPVSLSCHVSLAGTQRVNRGLLLSGSRGPRTVWRFRNIEGSRRLDAARKVITDKKEPSDDGGASEWTSVVQGKHGSDRGAIGGGRLFKTTQKKDDDK